MVLKERPTKWEQSSKFSYIPFTRSINMQSLSLQDYLGYSFVNNLSPIEDTRNIGLRIINVSDFAKSYPSYFLAWKNLTSDSKMFSFSSFEKFVEKSEFSKTVNHGFDLDLFGISINHKHTYTSTFGENRINDNKSVFGEIHIFVRDSCYRMAYSPTINKLILKNYLDKSFIQELHSIHPYEFYTKYGGLVAREFSSGGHAIALYNGLATNTNDDVTRENNLNKEMEASVSWDSKSNDGHLNFGRGGDSTISLTKSFSSVKMSLKTIGGFGSGSFSIPQEVNASTIDLSGWLSSLGDSRNHIIAEFNEDGLIPISDFIIESNLKSQFNNYLSGGKPQNVSISEPYILIAQVNQPTTPYSINEALIKTRYGQFISLIRFYVTTNQDSFKEFWQYINDIASIFELRIVNGSALPSPQITTYSSDVRLISGKFINLLAHKDNYRILIPIIRLFFESLLTAPRRQVFNPLKI